MELNWKTFLKYRWVILYFFSVGCFCLIFIFRIIPDISDMIRKKSVLSERNELIQQAFQVELQMDQYKTERTRLGNQLEHMVLSQDEEARLSTILNAISNVAKATKVRIRRIKPDQVRPMQSHFELPIEIDMASEYHALGRFLNRLETGQPIIRVESFDIRSESMLSAQLEIQINIVVLYLENHT